MASGCTSQTTRTWSWRWTTLHLAIPRWASAGDLPTLLALVRGRVHAVCMCMCVCMCVWVCVAACVPCLSNQVLLLRYSIFNRRGYVKINLIERPGRAGFYLERTLDITASPTVPALVITGANFGHPAASTRSYDATEVRVVCTKANLRELLSELSSLCYVLCAFVRVCCVQIIQARVDQAGGEWLNMLPTEDVHDLLGDP